MNTQRSCLSGHSLVELVSVLYFMSLSKCLLVLVCIYIFKLIASLTHIVYQTKLKQYDDFQLAIKILQLMLRYPLLTFTTTFSIRKNILPDGLFIYLSSKQSLVRDWFRGQHCHLKAKRFCFSIVEFACSPPGTSTVQRHARCSGFVPTLTSPTQLCGGQL